MSYTVLVLANITSKFNDPLFFFFKQKAAYEILTCDWSSDVCSSDLTSELRMSLLSPPYVAPVGLVGPVGPVGKASEYLEIGRASCRERV